MGLALWLKGQGGREIRRRWLAVGETLGLSTRYARADAWQLEGTVDGWRLRVERLAEDHRTRITLRPVQGRSLSAQVAFAAEPRALDRLLAGADREVGDPPFDAAVRIGDGDWPTSLALLDAHNRKRLMECVADGVRLEAGELIALIGPPPRIVEDLELRLRRLLRLARGLDLSERGVEARLAANARQDPVAAVRRANLEALLVHAPEHPLTFQAITDGLTAADPGLRLLAAEAAGADGRPALAGVVRDAAAAPALRARALERLVADAPADWVEAVLINHAGPEAPPRLRAVVATYAARRGLTPALLALAQEPAGVPPAALARVAQALAAAGPSAEPCLLALVEHGPDAVRIAAVEALATVGGPASAALLHGLTRGLTLPAELKAAARATLTRLGARLATRPGALSLAQAEGGALSAAPEEP